MTLRRRYITYRREFAGLVTGVTTHQPYWSQGDCPNCALGGSVPCGPHPDILVCSECLDEWPCDTIRTVAAELRVVGRDYGIRDPIRRTLLKRAAALLRGVRKHDAQHQDQSDLP